MLQSCLRYLALVCFEKIGDVWKSLDAVTGKDGSKDEVFDDNKIGLERHEDDLRRNDLNICRGWKEPIKYKSRPRVRSSETN